MNALELNRVCKQYDTFIEMNNASLTPHGYRGDAKKRDTELLRLCKEKNVRISLGSDSHGAAHVGDFTYALELIQECRFPEKLLINTDLDAFRSILSAHRQARLSYVNSL